jgi:Fe-S oxidoreductase
MTYEEFTAILKEIPNKELAEMAKNALRKLCSTGGQSFTMTVPPRLDDTDIVFAEVIRRFQLLYSMP